MTAFTNILMASLIAVFVQNSIFERALGINVLLYASRKREHLLGFFAAITYTTTISSAIIWNFDRLFAENEYYSIFMPILYVAVVSVLYIVTLVLIWRFFPKLFRNIRKYVHLSVFNCSVIGALFLCSVQGADIFTYIGYGFGNTSAASENMIFYDGKCHKIDRVRFEIPEKDLMQPWKFISSDGKFDMDFFPIYDDASKISTLLISRNSNQVFGRINGKAVLNDGTVLQVRNLLAFAERVRNRF